MFKFGSSIRKMSVDLTGFFLFYYSIIFYSSFYYIISIALRIKYKEKKEVFREENILVKEPFNIFKQWFDEAQNTPEILEPNAMCLSTVKK